MALCPFSANFAESAHTLCHTEEKGFCTRHRQEDSIVSNSKKRTTRCTGWLRAMPLARIPPTCAVACIDSSWGGGVEAHIAPHARRCRRQCSRGVVAIAALLAQGASVSSITHCEGDMAQHSAAQHSAWASQSKISTLLPGSTWPCRFCTTTCICVTSLTGAGPAAGGRAACGRESCIARQATCTDGSLI